MRFLISGLGEREGGQLLCVSGREVVNGVGSMLKEHVLTTSDMDLDCTAEHPWALQLLDLS